MYWQNCLGFQIQGGFCYMFQKMVANISKSAKIYVNAALELITFNYNKKNPVYFIFLVKFLYFYLSRKIPIYRIIRL